MFEVRTIADNRRIATTDTWSEAAAIQTYEQNFWGVPLYIVRIGA
jgi:hypothetical protein